jgi:hypothetical protein
MAKQQAQRRERGAGGTAPAFSEPLQTSRPEPASEAVSEPVPEAISEDEIARLAHSYWEARGGKGGSAEEDWLRAERELKAKRAEERGRGKGVSERAGHERSAAKA